MRDEMDKKKGYCMKKYKHDEFEKVIVCKGALQLAAPSLLKHVIENTQMMQSLNEQEILVLQSIIDTLIYDPTCEIQDVNQIVTALYLIGSFECEMVPLKNQLITTFVNSLTLANVLDVLELNEAYLAKRPEGNDILSSTREYCLDFMGTNAMDPLFDQFLESDPRLTKYLLSILKRRRIQDLVIEETEIALKPLTELFNQPEYSDIVLNIAGGDLYCHKTILASKSAYFDAMFNSNGNWNKEEVYAGEYLYLVHYCYDILDSHIPYNFIGPLIDIAHMHEMTPLSELVSEQFIITQDNFAPLCHYIISADPSSAGSRFVKDKMTEFFEDNPRFVVDNLNLIMGSPRDLDIPMDE